MKIIKEDDREKRKCEREQTGKGEQENRQAETSKNGGKTIKKRLPKTNRLQKKNGHRNIRRNLKETWKYQEKNIRRKAKRRMGEKKVSKRSRTRLQKKENVKILEENTKENDVEDT